MMVLWVNQQSANACTALSSNRRFRYKPARIFTAAHQRQMDPKVVLVLVLVLVWCRRFYMCD